MEFNQFIGIDWSGAKGPHLPGLQVAVCKDGKSAPELISSPKEGNWTRTALAEWLKTQIQNHGPILVGFDFAFAFPYCDKKSYFPKHDESPINREKLWSTIENICNSEKDFYGGPFYLKKNTSPFSEYLCYRKPTGKSYQELKKLRITDKKCLTFNVRPSTIFKFVGKGQVGTGSIAGIRFLYEIKKQLGDSISVWPFDENNNSKSVFLEIFPTLFYKMADQNTKEGHLVSACNNTLKHFDSDPIIGLKIKRKDESDAIISSAAIRCLSKDMNLWNPKEMNPEVRKYEGWIFGVS